MENYKIFDSELTDRGTTRKNIYVKSDAFSKAAQYQARLDFDKYLTQIKNDELKKQIIPYNETKYVCQDTCILLERWKLLQPKISFKEYIKKIKNG